MFNDIETRMCEVFRAIFLDKTSLPDDEIKLIRKNRTESWTSGAHLLLITCLEEEFGVNIPDEIAVDIDSFEKAVIAVMK